MATLWFSYSLPGGSLDVEEPISSPYTIAWHVGRFLRDKAASIGYAFKYINLDDATTQTFEPADIIIGHTWFEGGFMDAALSSVAKHKFILQPYSHYMVSPGHVQMVIDLWKRANHIFAITGEYWFGTIEQSPYAELKSHMTRLDMAISADKHPYSKTRWNKPGERAVCVIGHDTPTKGYRNVAELARVAGFRLGHFGSTDGQSFEHVPCMTLHGGVLFTPDNIRWICNEYDAVMALPVADACPTVLLEAAAWGLKVFASNKAGWARTDWIRGLWTDDKPRKIPSDVMQMNVALVREFQQADEYELNRDSLNARKIVETEYTWNKFCSTLWSKVEEYL